MINYHEITFLYLKDTIIYGKRKVKDIVRPEYDTIIEQ